MPDLFESMGLPIGAVPKVKDGALPSKQLEDYLSGRDTAPESAIVSWGKLYVYQAACQIRDMPSAQRRDAALAKIPAPLSALVKAEVDRLAARVR